VRVDRVYSWGPCGYSPKFFHCSIADGGCPLCTNCMVTPSYFFDDVARSVNAFVNSALLQDAWDPSSALVKTQTPTQTFVGSTSDSALLASRAQEQNTVHSAAGSAGLSPLMGAGIGLGALIMGAVGAVGVTRRTQRRSSKKAPMVSSGNPLATSL